MPLRVAGRRAIGGAMKTRGFFACLGLALLLPACRKPKEVTVEESRALTMRDEAPKLDATSNQRFQAPGSGPFIAGEVAVGTASGGLAENVNRWLGQFAKPGLSAEEVAKLPKGRIAGVEGVWVEASGDYAPGMGRPPRPGQTLYGLIAEDQGRIITVKMTGPAGEVAEQKQALQTFVNTLRRRGE